MRTIKFRGKRIDNGEWIYGNLINKIKPTEEKPVFWCSLIHDCALTAIVVYPETVGQFTGMFDKNGKEIFENDVLKIESWSLLWVVIFDIQKGHFTCKGINNDAKMDYIPYYHCEIINNITDNPELLKN